MIFLSVSDAQQASWSESMSSNWLIIHVTIKDTWDELNIPLMASGHFTTKACLSEAPQLPRLSFSYFQRIFKVIITKEHLGCRVNMLTFCDIWKNSERVFNLLVARLTLYINMKRCGFQWTWGGNTFMNWMLIRRDWKPVAFKSITVEGNTIWDAILKLRLGDFAQ